MVVEKTPLESDLEAIRSAIEDVGDTQEDLEAAGVPPDTDLRRRFHQITGCPGCTTQLEEARRPRCTTCSLGGRYIDGKPAEAGRRRRGAEAGAQKPGAEAWAQKHSSMNALDEDKAKEAEVPLRELDRVETFTHEAAPEVRRASQDAQKTLIHEC